MAWIGNNPAGINSNFATDSFTERRFRTHWQKVGKESIKETEEGRFGPPACRAGRAAAAGEGAGRRPGPCGGRCQVSDHPAGGTRGGCGDTPRVVESARQVRRATTARAAFVVLRVLVSDAPVGGFLFGRRVGYAGARIRPPGSVHVRIVSPESEKARTR
jgi:hypothetical protein